MKKATTISFHDVNVGDVIYHKFKNGSKSYPWIVEKTTIRKISGSGYNCDGELVDYYLETIDDAVIYIKHRANVGEHLYGKIERSTLKIIQKGSVVEYRKKGEDVTYFGRIGDVWADTFWINNGSKLLRLKTDDYEYREFVPLKISEPSNKKPPMLKFFEAIKLFKK